jgi:TatD DNase family protein
MKNFYDMHCHLGFSPQSALCAKQGEETGITALSCTTTPQEYECLLAELAPFTSMKVALGAHPWWIADGLLTAARLETFAELASHTPFIGEIGLDFNGERGEEAARTRQLEAFDALVGAFMATSSPRLVSLHSAGPSAATALLDTLEVAGAFKQHRIIFHWFSGSSDELTRALAAKAYFSVGPRMLATKKGREYAHQIPLERLLLETDMPARDGNDLPANVWLAELGNVVAGLSQLKNLSLEEVKTTLANTSAALLDFPESSL